MFRFSNLITNIYLELIRSFTGQIFTKEQIEHITSHTIGKHLTDFFPENESEKKAIERVEEARHHINQASLIISEMQLDLENQTNKLDLLLHDIEEKKIIAKKYEELANTNQEKFSLYKEEMASALRSELTEQSEQGKTQRRVASILLWLITLILGAGLGAYFKDIMQWLSQLV
jgi:predicted RNase H-like nuclease (RuvC/YqgF family)